MAQPTDGWRTEETSSPIRVVAVGIDTSRNEVARHPARPCGSCASAAGQPKEDAPSSGLQSVFAAILRGGLSVHLRAYPRQGSFWLLSVVLPNYKSSSDIRRVGSVRSRYGSRLYALAILFRCGVGRTSASMEARGGVWQADGTVSWIFGDSSIQGVRRAENVASRWPTYGPQWEFWRAYPRFARTRCAVCMRPWQFKRAHRRMWWLA